MYRQLRQSSSSSGKFCWTRSLIDLPAEQAAIDAASAAYQTKAKRWALVQDKVNRLQVVEDQIAALTP